MADGAQEGCRVMPRLRQPGALWEAQQQGAFAVDRIPEPQVEFAGHARGTATAKFMELLPATQFLALTRWARTLRPMRLEAA
jgi:hypothetical protein